MIVKDSDYIDTTTPAIVDADEYSEMMVNLPRIAKEALTYVDTYIAHTTGIAKLHAKQYNRLYGYSTLKYFHDVMGI